MSNQNLIKASVLAVVLLIASYGVFTLEHQRGTDINIGQELIGGLDVEKIYAFKILEEGTEVLSFRREDKDFILDNHHSYPTDASKINELLFNVSSITIFDKLRTTKEKFSELKVDEGSFKTSVVFYDESNKKMLQLYVGKTAKGNKRYVRLKGKDEVYLSAKDVSILTTKDSYIDKKILKFKNDMVTSVEVRPSKGNSYQIKRDPKGKTKVITAKKMKFDESKLTKALDSANDLLLSDFYFVGDEEVNNLKFDRYYRVKLKDGSSYQIQIASRKKNKEDEHFVKLSMNLENMPEKVVLDQSSKEDIKRVDKLLKLQTKYQQFNNKHGRWIYKVTKDQAEKLEKPVTDFKSSKNS